MTGSLMVLAFCVLFIAYWIVSPFLAMNSYVLWDKLNVQYIGARLHYVYHTWVLMWYRWGPTI